MVSDLIRIYLVLLTQCLGATQGIFKTEVRTPPLTRLPLTTFLYSHQLRLPHQH